MRDATGSASPRALRLTTAVPGTNRKGAIPSLCLRHTPWTRVLITVLALTTLAAAQGSPLFTTISLSPVASLPLAVASGDFNGDGIPDQAVTSSGTNAVSILLGTGDGNFLPAVNYPVGADPVAIVAGDFNHDGHLDLAVLNSNPNTGGAGGSVSILNGQSNGTFVAGPTLAVGFIPTAIAAGDFDEDGNLDLAVVVSNPNGSFNPGFVTILLGSANGSFVAQGNYGVGLAPVSIAVGDFNGDGKLDLAVGSAADGLNFNPQSEISILLNNGSGGFQAGSSFATAPAGNTPISIAVADFNDDARLDLAVAMNNTTNVLICQGNGDGTFSIVNAPGVGGSPIWVAAGDFNGDGKPDLMVANNADSTVSVLLGNGDETFSGSATYSVGTHPTNLALADLNGDGKLDVAVVNNGDSTAQVFLGEGDGTFRSGSYRVGANPTGITSGDFNKDGFPDLAVLNGDGTVSVLLGDGHGGFRTMSPFPGCQGSSPLTGPIVAGDFNADGKVDLVTSCKNLGEVEAFTGNGDGTFQLATAYSLGVVDGMISADLNGDGFPEVVLENGPDVIFFNLLGFNGFAYEIGDVREVVAGDFNGDGKTDLLAVSTYANSGTTPLLGDGSGNFQPGPVAAMGNRALGADFDGDGLSDFAYQDGFGNSVGIKLSNGDGTFRDGSRLACCSIASNTGDFNGDGIPDAVTLVGDAGSGDVFLGQLDGSFVSSGTPLSFASSFAFFNQTVVADFDTNGSQDLAVLDISTGTVHILLNKNSFQLTNTVLSESPAHVVAGQPLNLSVAVGSKQGTPTGGVVFKQAGIVQTTQALNAGAAQTTLSAPSAVGQFGYTALYTGDGTYSGSLSQRLVVTVSPASTTTIVTSSDPTSKLGQSVTFTATIAPQFSGEPSGTVKFFADGAPLGTANVNGGQATIGTASLAMGNHTIEADYSGDASFITSLGLMKQNVGKAVSTVALTSSLNPAPYGQPVTLTATVTNSDGSTPTGPVVFAEGSTVYGTVSLSGGAAQVVLPTLIVGNHKITAQYGGDTSNSSDKANFTETITGGPSTTTVTSSAQPSTYAQSVSFTAVVSGAGATPDGTVTFKNGRSVLGTVALMGGQAVFAVDTLTGGSHTINAVYNGNSMYTSSTGSVPQIVEPVATTTTLTSSLNPAPSGQTVTLTAVVTSPAVALPTGKLTIKDGKTVLISTTLVNGQAQVSTSLLTTGAHNITATFAGSASFASSQTTLSQLIQ